MSKPYVAKTLTGAQAEVRRLRKQLAETEEMLELLWNDRRMLAMLAAEGPAFFNPLKAMAAKKVRDRVLASMNMNPDGSFKQRSA